MPESEMEKEHLYPKEYVNLNQTAIVYYTAVPQKKMKWMEAPKLKQKLHVIYTW